MKRIGLNAKRYLQAMRGLVRPELYPDHPTKSTEAAAGELRVRGYAATADKLKTLVRAEIIPASENDGKQAAWNRERIEAAANILEEREDFTAEAAYLSERGLTMTDKQDALESAYAAAIDELGRVAVSVLSPTANEDFFLQTIEPPYRNAKATIRYSLAPKVREEIERKKQGE